MSDFGFADQDQTSSNFKRNAYYLAPEIVERKILDEKIDVWSAGCVIAELFNFSNTTYAEF